MKSRAETAAARFLGGYNCAQAVLFAFCGDVGLDPDTALRLACGFGAGMARSQQTCGAVTGGIVVLGLKYGRGEGEDRTATETTYAKTRDLMARFAQRHGTCACRELLGGCDLGTEEGQRRFKEQDLLNKVCRSAIESAVEILEEIAPGWPSRR